MKVFRIKTAQALLARRAPLLARRARRIPFHTYSSYHRDTTARAEISVKHTRKGKARWIYGKERFINEGTIEQLAYGLGFLMLALEDKKTQLLNRSVCGEERRRKLMVSYNVILRKRMDKLMNRPDTDRGFENLVANNMAMDLERLRSYDETPPLYHFMKEHTEQNHRTWYQRMYDKIQERIAA